MTNPISITTPKSTTNRFPMKNPNPTTNQVPTTNPIPMTYQIPSTNQGPSTDQDLMAAHDPMMPLASILPACLYKPKKTGEVYEYTGPPCAGIVLPNGARMKACQYIGNAYVNEEGDKADIIIMGFKVDRDPYPENTVRFMGKGKHKAQPERTVRVEGKGKQKEEKGREFNSSK
ncbi:hypothetical protein K505DRAFT_373468 [Melanomma pulvis-pyrius CBS 109.77]|uniref:Uncharacterized protein n=1 Tax=Melanomma pulvis-pyrius CBS 109.77 TaxID=1314802 RepID=A0A6A6XIN4_9PLEO|nr:hypothetical protein K505DRAFT_373468 [Melanomma pulvis-pyrius CBS 109.77]